MNTPLARSLMKATQLTRAGHLIEATALIRSALMNQAPASAPEGAAIEGTFTRLEPEAPRPAPKRASKAAQGKPSGLKETLRRIAAGGMPAGKAAARGTGPLPEGAAFLSLTHQGPAGSRAYRLYVPASKPAGPVPLVLMLHGCTQTPEDFALGTGMNALAEEQGWLVAYPAQPSGANAQKCWNWFRPEDQARGAGEPALMAALVHEIQSNHGADPQRTYVAGLSAGGAAAVALAAAYPEVFSAVGVHSGLPVGGAQDIPSAFAAMRNGSSGAPHRAALPTIVFHGLADSTVSPQNGAAVLAQALPAMNGLRKSVKKGTAEGGRAYRATLYAQADGRSMAEHWEIEGAGHAWSGGDAGGSYTDPKGPSASRQFLRFFAQHSLSPA